MIRGGGFRHRRQSVPLHDQDSLPARSVRRWTLARSLAVEERWQHGGRLCALDLLAARRLERLPSCVPLHYPSRISRCTTLFLTTCRTTLTTLPHHGSALTGPLQDPMKHETCCQHVAARCLGRLSQFLAHQLPRRSRVYEPEELMVFDVSGNHLISTDSGFSFVLQMSLLTAQCELQQ